MKIENLKIFDHEIIKHKVPKHIYSSKSLQKSVDKIFENKKIINKSQSVLQNSGKIFTTVSSRFKNNIITNLKDINPLMEYISFFILKNYFKVDSEDVKVIYDKMWINKNFLNSSVKSHVHEHDYRNRGTAIFYLNAPTNSGKFIVLKGKIGNDNSTGAGIDIDETHKDIAHYIDVETGDLIIHNNNVFHAVSKHMNSNPRISFIFDFYLENKKETNTKKLIYI